MDGKEALKYIGKIARTVDETTEQPQSTMCPDAVPFEEPENLDGLQRSLDPEALHDEDELVSPDTMPFVDDAKTSASDGVSINEDELVSPDAMPFIDDAKTSATDGVSINEDELVSPDAMPFIDDGKTSASDGVSIDEDEAMSPDTVPFEDTKNPPQDPDGPLMGQE